MADLQPIGAGGIFLVTNPQIQTPSPHSAPSVKPVLAAMDWCNQIQEDFLKLHKGEAQQQPLTKINHVITYLNGTLQLWKKQTNNSLIQTDSVDTPALKTDYKLCKSFPHISVMIYSVLQSICIMRVKNEHHQADLLRIEDRLLQINQLDEEWVNSHRSIIELFLSVVTDAKSSSCVIQIYQLMLRHIEQTTLINENYGKQATALQLEGMHDIVLPWIKNIDLKETRVLIAVAAGPKQQLIEGQYFLSLYKERGIIDPLNDQKIIYVEMLPQQLSTIDSQCLIDVLKEKMLNRTIAKDMLGNEKAMNEDVLGRFAPNVLQRLCPHSRMFKTPSSKEPDDHPKILPKDVIQVPEAVVNKKTCPLRTIWAAGFYKPQAANENKEQSLPQSTFKR